MEKFRKLIERTTKRPYRQEPAADGAYAIWAQITPTSSMQVAKTGHAEFDRINARLLTLASNNVEELVETLNALLDSSGARGIFSLMREADASERAESLLAKIEKEAAE